MWRVILVLLLYHGACGHHAHLGVLEHHPSSGSGTNTCTTVGQMARQVHPTLFLLFFSKENCTLHKHTLHARTLLYSAVFHTLLHGYVVHMFLLMGAWMRVCHWICYSSLVVPWEFFPLNTWGLIRGICVSWCPMKIGGEHWNDYFPC